VTSQKRRAFQWRLATTALSASLGALLLIFFFWRAGEWAYQTFLIENDTFAVQTIHIQTDGIISADQLRRWAGIKEGDNLLAMDLFRIRRNLELAPLIKEAAVERILPNTLKIRVSEREPMAQAYVWVPKPDQSGYEASVYYLDDEGYVMLPLESGLRASLPSLNQESLTILWGLNSNDLRPSRRVDSRQVLAALRLIEVFESSPLFGIVDLDRIDLSQPEVLRVITGQGTEVILALDPLEVQLRRWRAIHDYGQKMGKAIAHLDLSVTNNLPALWVEASSVPPAKPKTTKSFHYRRKHV
jgi:hypothetical protein